MKRLIDFFKREWFLFVMLGAIALIIWLYEFL